MIRFRDTQNRTGPPQWLADMPNVHRRASSGGDLWMRGDAVCLSDAGPWRPISDGYEVAGPVESAEDYEIDPTWFSIRRVTDMAGREWAIPSVLDANGDRAFRVGYGPDFLPELTAVQYHVLEIAKAARDAIAASTSGTQDAGVQVACRWAASLLSVAYSLPVDAIAALRILDDVLVIGAISAAIGLSCRVES